MEFMNHLWKYGPKMEIHGIYDTFISQTIYSSGPKYKLEVG